MLERTTEFASLGDLEKALARGSVWRKREIIAFLITQGLDYTECHRHDSSNSGQESVGYRYSFEDEALSEVGEDIDPVAIIYNRFHSRIHHASVRGTILIVYSHWEGFLKTALTNYLEWLGYLNEEDARVHPRLYCYAHREKINQIEDALEKRRKSIDKLLKAKRIEAPSFPTGYYDPSSEDQRVVVLNKGTISSLVSTNSNLSDVQLKKIFKKLDMDCPYQHNEELKLIKKLVDTRNGIAHGDSEDRFRVPLGVDGYDVPRFVNFVLRSFEKFTNTIIEKADEVDRNRDSK